MIITFKDLADKIRIESDGLNFVPQVAKVVEAGRLTKEENIGKVRWENLGFYSTLGAAVLKLARHLTEQRAEEMDVTDYIDTYNSISQELTETFSSHLTI